MAEKVRIELSSAFDPRGTQAATRAITDLLKAVTKLGATKGGDGLAKAFVAQQQAAAKAAQASAQVAVANARAAASQQQLAAATSRAVAAQASAEAAQSRAAQSALRLSAAQDRAQQSAQRAASGQQSWSAAIRQTAGNVDSLIGAATSLGGAFAVISAGQAVFRLAETGAAAQAARASFDSLAASANTTGAALLSQLQAAAGGAVASTDIIKSANTALLLLGADVATKLPQLLEIAKASATALGTDVGQVFDALVTGISRNSTELIDNAGITIKSGEAYATYAASIGKSVAELSAAERQQAILNAVLESGQRIVEQTAAAGDTNALAFQRFNAAVSDLTTALGGLLANGLAPLAQAGAEAFAWVAEGINQLSGLEAKVADVEASILEGAGGYEEYRAGIEQANDAAAGSIVSFEGLSEAQFTLAKAMMEGGASASQAAAAVAALGPVTDAYTNALGKASKEGPAASAAISALESTILRTASASDEGRAATETLITSYLDNMISASELAGQLALLEQQQYMQASAQAESTVMTDDGTAATEGQTLALDENFAALTNESVAKQTAALEAEILAQRQAELMDAAYAAASGSGNLEAAAAQLAGQFGISTDEAYKLIAAIRQLNALTGGVSAKGGPTSYTPASKEQIAARQAEIEEMRNNRGGGGGRGRSGGGSGAARINEAERAASRLAEIEQRAGERITEINEQTAEKLIDIDQRTQDRLIAIDQQAADARAQIAQQLADDLAMAAADSAFADEANDLDLVGEADKERLAMLRAREQAEAEAAARRAALAEETQQRIAEGDVESAEASFEAQSKAIDARQQLDQAYYEKQAELAGNPEALAELDAQYQEAVAALEARTATEIAIEEAKIAARAAALEEEKAMVIAAAEEEKIAVIAKAQEQKDAVIAAALEQASKVKGASAEATAAIGENLATQNAAVSNWAAATERAAARVAEAYRSAAAAAATLPAPPSGSGNSGGGSATGSTKAAGGGTFLTSGPTTLTVGDNPGGVEMVNVVPLSGTGTTTVGGNMARMAGGGSLITGMGEMGSLPMGDPAALEAYAEMIADVRSILEDIAEVSAQSARIPLLPPIDPRALDRLVAESATVLSALRGEVIPIAEEEADAFGRYADVVGDSIGILLDIADLADSLKPITPPLNPEMIRRLAEESVAVGREVGRILINPPEEAYQILQRYADAVRLSVGVLADLQGLRDQLSVPRSPIPLDYIRTLALEAQQVGSIVGSTLRDPPEAALVMLRKYAEAVAGSIAVLVDTQALREDLSAPRSPIPVEYIKALALEAQQVGSIVGSTLRDPPDDALQVLREYQEAVAGSIQVLLDVQDLRAELGSPKPPISLEYVRTLALEAQRVGSIIGSTLRDPPDDALQVLREYAEAVRGSVDILISLADLRERLGTPLPPINLAVVRLMAVQAAQVVQLVRGNLLPTTEEQADALQRYADAARAAVDVIIGVADLRERLGEPLPPISLAFVQTLAREAQRVTDMVRDNLLPTTEDQAEAFRRYADAAGASVDVLMGVADLRASLAEPQPPISEADITRLADDAKRITTIMRARLVPTTEDQAAEAQRYADAAGASVGIIGDVLSLSGNLFTDYRSPSNAELAMLATDAERITDAFRTAADRIGVDGSEAAMAYGDALNSLFSAAKEGLLVIDALNSGDFVLDRSKLDQFAASTTDIYGVLSRLGAEAQGIAPDALAAMERSASALRSQSEAFVALAAVPFGNLSGLSAEVGGLGGGGSMTSNAVTFAPGSIIINAAPGMDATTLANQVTQQVIQRLNNQVGARR